MRRSGSCMLKVKDIPHPGRAPLWGSTSPDRSFLEGLASSLGFNFLALTLAFVNCFWLVVMYPKTSLASICICVFGFQFSVFGIQCSVFSFQYSVGFGSSQLLTQRGRDRDRVF